MSETSDQPRVSFEPVLLKYKDAQHSHTIEHYLARDGYAVFKSALKQHSPEDIQKIVSDSGLRGRGGAGFPTGKKWSFLAKNTGKPVYLAVNGDESEPGTFKDRYLIERDPHQLLEGVMLTSYAIGSSHAFIYLRGEFIEGYHRLKQAISDAAKHALLGTNILSSNFSLKITLVRGGGAYICGEETALLSSIEGGRGYPKLKPPFPAVAGVFGAPTIINNVETISNVPHIVKHGAAWYRQWGTEKSPGFKIFCLSGHVERAGVYELPLGTPLMELIEHYGGGVKNKKSIKAVIPGGSSTPLITKDHIHDVCLDYESVAVHGSMFGSGAVTVLDENTDMVDALYNLTRFYHHESCGQCTPCREGTGWIEQLVRKIHKGRASQKDLELLLNICENIRGKTICPLSDAAITPVFSYIKEFRAEFESKLIDKRVLQTGRTS